MAGTHFGSRRLFFYKKRCARESVQTPPPCSNFHGNGKKSQAPYPRNCTAEETISTLGLVGGTGNAESEQRKKLSDRYFRKGSRKVDTTRRAGEYREVAPTAEIAHDEESVSS